jgi:hypothetical protein
MENITEQELKEYAGAQAATIVIRTYENGNSTDTRRKATRRERAAIKGILFGGLLSIRFGCKLDGVTNTCEFIGNVQLPGMNGYDTIYRPLVEWYEWNKNRLANPA